MKLLVIGRNGQIARALARRGAACVGRPEVDIAEPDSLRAVFERHAPEVVINAAAYTAVDAAESDEAQAHRVNAEGAGALALLCAAADAALIHISTDYVFSGDKAGAYVESDPPAPRSAYGRSKYAGERAVREARGRHLIVRTAWVHSGDGRNFVRTMLRLARQRSEVAVVDDQRGSPSYAGDIAEGLLKLAAAAKRAASLSGVLHLAGDGACTWAEFAEAVFAESARRGGPSASVRRITSAEYPMPAARPANSVLDCAKAEQLYSIRTPHWRDGVAKCMDDIAEGGWLLD